MFDVRHVVEVTNNISNCYVAKQKSQFVSVDWYILYLIIVSLWYPI